VPDFNFFEDIFLFTLIMHEFFKLLLIFKPIILLPHFLITFHYFIREDSYHFNKRQDFNFLAYYSKGITHLIDFKFIHLSYVFPFYHTSIQNLDFS
jgi:hypothetical protein